MKSPRHWTAADIPDQSGRTALVTGANSGLGYETALALARKGARVILASRSKQRGDQARQDILNAVPGAILDLRELDLASLVSIRRIADEIKADYPVLDLLVNNAGLMATPYSKTEDGFEMQFGVNHLGHFALTGLLLDRLLAAPGSRVVTVSSVAHLMGRIRFNDLHWEKGYERWTAYGQSKLANLLFAYELQRRLSAAGSGTISVAAHPGFSATNLRHVQIEQNPPLFQRLLFYLFEGMTRQDAAMGSLPILYAATAPGVNGGEFYSPSGILQMSGYPRRVRSSRQSYNLDVAQHLWRVSSDLTGVVPPV